jgi:glycosyltransferase involved in cell wall biosynthesis
MPASRVLLNGSFAPSVTNFRGPLIRDLVANGHDVVVSVPDVGLEERSRIEGLGARVYEVPLDRAGSNPLSDLRYFMAMRRLVRRTKPDLVLNYTVKPNIWGGLAAASLGVRSVSMVTGLGQTFSGEGGWRTGAIRRVVRVLYRRATDANDLVIFQNPDDILDFVSAGYLADRNKARRIFGSGVDMDHFRQTPLPEQPVFLMAARLLIEKGVREYAQAAIAAMTQRPDLRFILAGEYDDTSSTVDRDEIEAWQEAGIEFLGWVNDIRRPLAQASVFVLPTYYREGTPRSVLEASALGRPVITTDAPGAREAVIDGKTGLLVPPRDASSLYTAIMKLAESRDLRARMGQHAREFCEQIYDANKVNAQLMEYLGLTTDSR